MVVRDPDFPAFIQIAVMGIAALNHILQKPARPATSYKKALSQ
jgi:hypothetical protein